VVLPLFKEDNLAIKGGPNPGLRQLYISNFTNLGVNLLIKMMNETQLNDSWNSQFQPGWLTSHAMPSGVTQSAM
jgi:hypothetical protein